VLNNLGNALHDAGALDEAARTLGRVVSAHGAAALNDHGVRLHAAGRAGEAVGLLRRAIALRPDHPDAYANLGTAQRAQGDAGTGKRLLGRALTLDPGLVAARYNLGNALLAEERFSDATAQFRAALALRPDDSPAFNNLGVAARESGDPRSAADAFARATRLRGAKAEGVANLGAAMLDLGELDDAAARLEQAARLDPTCAQARKNLGMTLLLRGDLEQGWAEYEHRWDTADFRRRTFIQPLWRGEDIAGRTILVYAEQGLGDTLQFARYVPLLAARGARVILEAPRPLHRLLASLPGEATLIGVDEPRPDFDVHCPLLSLPLAFGTRLETIPAPIPYLAAEPARVAAWRDRLPKAALRVGIVWQGNPAARIDRGRSPPLSCIVPLARIPGVALVSLQKNHGLDQLAALPPDVRVHAPGDGFDAGPDAFLDTAAVMESLDLIVTSDTSVVHLAGALGRPTWVALKAVPDWRWLMDRTDSPWYPTLRLFRQATRGGWEGVFGPMAVELAATRTRHLQRNSTNEHQGRARSLPQSYPLEALSALPCATGNTGRTAST
ncbi:MAG TPA: tetratricopeptide repeat protein, partial [Azospirillum sp.]